MGLKLVRFDPSPFGFPRPGAPLLPDRAAPPAGDSGDAIAFARRRFACRDFAFGRYALGAAYRLCGVGPGALMAPAYHCLSMIDPAVVLGAEIRFYPFNPDLSPDLDRLDAVFAQAGRPVTALLAAHFFGLVQDFAPLKRWCDARGVALIEDGSHTLFTENFQAPGAGGFGRFVTASPYKFFACEDGGLLCAADADDLAAVSTEPPGWLDEARGFKRLLERRNARPPVASPIDARETPPFVTRLAESDYRRPSPYYDPALARRAALRVSRRRIAHSPPGDIAAGRRRNYRRWLAACAAWPGARPLYPDWPADAAPYMFPLVIERPDPDFFRLKRAGLPIWRWDERAVAPGAPDCGVARHYQLHLLHLPCHQGLDAARMDWMIAVAGSVLEENTG